MPSVKTLSLPALVLAALLPVACTSDLPVKVYVLAGQSNMVGPGSNAWLKEHAPELLAPRDDVWCAYAGKVPGPLKPGYGFRTTSFGPELTFGHVMGDAIDNDIVIIKSGQGGTTLHVNWRPPSAVRRAGGEVGPLYSTMIRRVHRLLENLDAVSPTFKGRPYELAGFVWFQGENDSCGRTKDGVGYWNFYRENLQDLLKDVRSDLGSPHLPVVIAQINDGCWDGKNRGGPQVRAAQEYVAAHDDNAAMIVTRDLNEGYHYDSASHVVIGRRMAAAMLPLSRGRVETDPVAVRQAGLRFLKRERERKPAAGGAGDVASLRKGLIGYWKFDEGSGDGSADRSGKGNRAVLRGGPTWAKGLFGHAVKLTGAQSVEVPGFAEPLGPDKTIEALTVSFWIRTPSAMGVHRVGKGVGREIGKRGKDTWFISDRANVAGWDVCNFDPDGDGFPHFTATIEGVGMKVAYSSWGNPTLSGDGFEWRHVASVYDGASRSMLMYVDGQLVKNVRRDVGGKHIRPADVVLQIGGPLREARSFQAYDEVAIWSRALTAEEVAALYNGGAGAEVPID